MDRKQIKHNAKDGMHFRYWPIVGIELIAGVLTGGGFSIGSSFSNNSSNWQQASNNEYAAGIMSILAVIGAIAAAVGIVYMILFGNVISVGQSGVRLAAYRKQEFAIKDLFKGLKRYGRIVGTMALYTLFVMLGFFCFIVPGIIVAYGLFEVPYLLSEDESLSGMAAIRRSWEDMKGYKGKLFVLHLSFFGWAMLTILTLGVLSVFYTGPYMALSEAGFFHERQQLNAAETGATPEA